jgi:hypothetical protein
VFLNNQTHLGNAEAKCDGTNMLLTMTFKIAQVNIVKEVEPNIIGLSRN